MHENPLIDLLAAYGPSSSSDQLYDEHVMRSTEATGCPPIEIETRLVSDLATLLASETPPNIVLTGTAGDGKTYTCRKVFLELGGDPADWHSSRAVVELVLQSGHRLRVVKDLSELADIEKDRELVRFARETLELQSDLSFLIAANDGQLLSFFRRVEDQNHATRGMLDLFSSMLKDDLDRDLSGVRRLRLFNLSLQTDLDFLNRLIVTALDREDWELCRGCALLASDICPIRHNRRLLQSAEHPVRKRLVELVRLLAANDSHLPIRQQLLLVVNMLLADGKKYGGLLNCAKAHNLAEDEEWAFTNPFDAVVGLNLRPSTRRQFRAFATIEALGLGRETNNLIDGLIIDGKPEDLYNSVIRSDPRYGHELLESYRQQYIRGTFADFQSEINPALEAQRRRLFFNLIDDPDAPIRPWHLTVFTHGGDYLRLMEALAAGRDPVAIKGQLIRGLNRSYTGMMCRTDDKLYLAAPPAGLSGRMGQLLDGLPIPARKIHQALFHIALEAETSQGRPRFVARDFQNTELGSLVIKPLLFEYLMRVANGALPSSFSRQCLEELRHFRLNLQAAFAQRDSELGGDGDRVTFELVRLDPGSGALVDNSFSFTVVEER